MTMTTQAFLEQAYSNVSNDLAAQMRKLKREGDHEIALLSRLAGALGLAEDPPPPFSKELTSIALRPLAQICVVAVLRDFFATARQRDGQAIITENDITRSCLDRVGADISENQAQVSREEAAIALRSTWKILAELLQVAVDLTMNDETFSVHRRLDGVHVVRSPRPTVEPALEGKGSPRPRRDVRSKA